VETVTQVPVLGSADWLAAIENTDQGEPVPTLFGSYIPGYAKGRASIVGAETEVGKTMWGLQSFKYAIDNGVSGAYVTLEMTPADLFERLWPMFNSRNDEELARLQAKDWIKSNPVFVSESYLDAHEIEQVIRAGYDFVVVDHIHEIPFDGHEDLGRKVRRLASLAPATNTSILFLSQMKQRPPEFVDGPPTKRDFSWTKAISEVAATLMALWRPDDDIHNQVELVCLKNRFGQKTLPLSLQVNPRTVSFEIKQSEWTP